MPAAVAAHMDRTLNIACALVHRSHVMPNDLAARTKDRLETRAKGVDIFTLACAYLERERQQGAILPYAALPASLVRLTHPDSLGSH